VITLRPLTLAELNELGEGSTQLPDVAIAEDALPPPFLLDLARNAMLSGEPPQWVTSYLFVRANVAVGSGGFKGAPRDGAVEIGYGIAEGLRGCGLATEGVKALVALAFRDESVRCLRAETSVGNVPSRRVVEKNGFVHMGQRHDTEDGLLDLWQLNRG
jgi:RimJ/RimL family protein N-acetyltransferase